MDDKLAKVLYHMNCECLSVNFNLDSLEDRINKNEKLLSEFGIDARTELLDLDNDSINCSSKNTHKEIIRIKSFDEIYNEANESHPDEISIEDLFSEDELKKNKEECKRIIKEFNKMYSLDATDYLICTAGAIISSIIDILLIGIPHKTTEGLKAGRLADYIREHFEKVFPQDKMEKLANETRTKVSYDAQDNRNTVEYVEGLSTYYHRLLSLGHDPILGFFVGVIDIFKGQMTTIDKKGKFAIQVIEEYSERKGKDIFESITKQILHLESDITTSMGLPVPFMALFNLLQFGKIGDKKLTIAEIVQGMYYEGFDFIHFCSQSISVMVLEVFVRVCSFIKHKMEFIELQKQMSTDYKITGNPKIVSVLFVSHLETVAINTGKVYFTKNPLSINYAEWLTFAKSLLGFVKFNIISKPELRDKFFYDKLKDEFTDLYEGIEIDFLDTFSDCEFEL